MTSSIPTDLAHRPTLSLVGLPGGGKSTVGKPLARRLKYRFVDADAQIEARIGGTISDFFAREGEGRFRDWEENILAELTCHACTVLATGGGAVIRQRNRQILRERTTVVYLHASPEETFRRLRHDTQRPLLQVPDPLATLRALYAQRDPWYREVAHFTIETGRCSLSLLVNKILMQLEMAVGAGDRQGAASGLGP